MVAFEQRFKRETIQINSVMILRNNWQNACVLECSMHLMAVQVPVISHFHCLCGSAVISAFGHSVSSLSSPVL